MGSLSLGECAWISQNLSDLCFFRDVGMLTIVSFFCPGDILLMVLAVFLPPLAVLIKKGLDMHLCINIILCIVGTLAFISLSIDNQLTNKQKTLFFFKGLWIGGIIHAWYIIVTEA